MHDRPAGTSAALPEPGYWRSPALDDGGLVVTHVNEKGDGRAVYDFGRLSGSEGLRRSLAALFAGRLGPGGPWRNTATSREMWMLLGTFTRFLAEQDDPPRDIGQISRAVWNSWRVSRPATPMGQRQIGKVGVLLRLDPQLPADTREATMKRVVKIKAKETSYTAEEFGQIKAATTRSFHAAWRRITGNQRHLQEWRAGRFEEQSMPWLLGEALERLAVTGDIPTRSYGTGQCRMPEPRYLQALGGGGAEHTWQRLFLSSAELVSLGVLLVIACGWNATPVSELCLPQTMAGGGGDETVVHRIELEKRRRHAPHRYETRNLTDFGPGSPGRLITRAVEATAPARITLEAAGSPSSRLLIWHAAKPLDVCNPAGLFRFGFGDSEVRTWKARAGSAGLNLRRLRRTVNVLHRRTATQNSQDVHDSIYVLRDPRAREQADPVFTSGIEAAIIHAETTVRAQLSRDDTAGRGTDTATASCGDYRHSPFSPHGSPCRASFLLCLACPNAVITPRHLPRLAYLAAVLEELRSVLPEAVWDHDWREHHERLAQLRRDCFTPAEWADALTAEGPQDRALIDRLLRGGFGS